MKHVECSAPAPNGNSANFVVTGDTTYQASNETIQYCYVHGGLVSVLIYGSNVTLDHCFLGNCGGQQHSEIICIGAASQNVIIRYSFLCNLLGPSGTTYIEPQQNGGPAPNGIYIYGNVFWAYSPNDWEANPSALSLTSGETASNIYFYNNTLYGLKPVSGGYQDSGLGCDSNGNACSNVVVRNNIWQACTYAPGFSGVTTQDHNILNTGGASFVNAAAGNFRLAANTSSGVNLGAPYNIDPDGNTRTTWSLGAYEYVSVSTNSIIAVSPASLAFGAVPQGTTVTNYFTVKNAGSGLLAGTAAISGISTNFTVVLGGTYSLSANQSAQVGISYTPSSNADSAVVTFTGGGQASANVSGQLQVASRPSPPSAPANLRVVASK